MEPPPTSDAPPTRIVLIRHGESRSTVDRVVGGHGGCQGLTDRGRRQAEALADRLAATGELSDASVLVTSILPRAIETAKLISPALGDLEATERCDFCEIHSGEEADGISWEEFSRRYIPDGEGRHHYQPWATGGESWAMLFARVGAALFDVAALHPGRTVVVACHGGVIQGSFGAFGRQPLDQAFDLAVENTSITEWQLPDPTEAPHKGRWKLVRFNDAAHVAGL